jgi:CheY-like chemotaxis protein
MEAMGRLASGVAHDFGNDLTAILGNADMMRQDLPEGADLAEPLAQIVQAAERSAALSQQLLAFGQTQSMDLQRVEPCQLIADLTPVLERICGPTVGLELELAGCGTMVQLNAAQLEMGVINLATNARDAMPGGGRLVIGCRALQVDDPGAVAPSLEPGRFVEIRVTDEGQGMDPATCSRVFEPFFTTKEAGQGTGLGLATLHRFVTHSGGAIEIESEVGVGSSFRILLPATEPTLSAGNETLLVVGGQRSAARPALEACGYRVEEVDDLDAAIDRVAREAGIDLLVCDLEDRTARGAGFMVRLRSTAPDLPVLVLAPDGLAAGWHDRLDPNRRVLAKPFTTQDLNGGVRELLEKRFVAR